MFARVFFLNILISAVLLTPSAANEFSTIGESPFGKYLIGQHAENEGNMRIAAEHFADVFEQENNPEILRHLFLLYVTSGDFSSARSLAAKLLEVDPDTASASMFSGLSAFKSYDYDTALAAFKSLETVPAGRWISPIVSAWILQQRQQYEEAANLLASIEESDSLVGFRYFHEALMSDLEGNARRAEKQYLLAIEAVDGSVLRFIEGYGNFLERQGRKYEARYFYKENLQTDGFAQGLWETRREAIKRGEIPEPLVRDGFEGSAELFYEIFTLLSFEGGDDIALAYLPYLRFALFLHPELHEARLLLGERYEQIEFFDSALESYNAIPKTSPYYINAQAHIAQIYEKMEKTDEAFEVLFRLSEERPESRVATLALATFYRINERYDEAITTYSSVIDALESPSQRDWNIFYGRAIAYERSDRWSEAEEDLKLAMRLSDENPYVLNYLGYSWVEQGERLTLALDMLKKATQERPRNGFIVDSLGWAYYKLGDFDRANYYLERAVELEPGDPIINDHLGDSFWQSGRKLEARFQWRRALSLDPEEEEVVVIEKKLLRGLSP